MKPALSVILFTVSSGAGLGLAIWIFAAQLAGRIDGSLRGFWIGTVLAGVLFTVGLLASTRHLANPRNAWRSFARVRTSWLSREAVLAVAFIPLAAVHVMFSAQGSPNALVTAVVAIVVALAIIVCTAMIYACLKTVPRWRTWHTVPAYLLYALASGGLLWRAVLASDALPVPSVGWVLVPVLGAALVKLGWDAKFSARVHATLNEALAVPETAAPGHAQGRVRLLDVGHAHGTFLTHEFGFVLARERASALRALQYGLTVAVPVLALLLSPVAVGSWVAAVAMLTGVLIERWLFFARAEHVVRLYHGSTTV